MSETSRTVAEIRDQHNKNVKNAAFDLRRLRRLPDDQDIDRDEALRLVRDGYDKQTLLDEIERLSTEGERKDEALRQILDWCHAYPEDVFTPLQGDPLKKTGDYDTEEKRDLITRASASMGRLIFERFPEIIEPVLSKAWYMTD